MATVELERPKTITAETERATVATPASERLLALDVFRGMTIAGMLLVNDPGSWGAIYEPLEHAPWHGWTPTDLVFPFFLFIVGITTHLSLGRRRAAGAERSALVKKVIRRGLLIVLFGLLLNAFPFFWWGKMAGFDHPTFLQRVAWRFEHLRFMGVLQRIGIVYLVTGLVALRASRKQILVTIGAILIGYWIVMTLVPVPGTGTIGYFLLDQPDKTLAAWSDRLILTTTHTWVSTKTWDPEGPLSTIPAIATALLGLLAGEWITKKERPLIERVAAMYAVGCLVMLAGKFWSWVFPINKNLWTSSYVLFCAGFASVVLATCIWLVDVQRVRRWTIPFVVYGLNPLVAFVGSGVMARCIDSLFKVTVAGKQISIHQWSYSLVFEPFFEPKFASLLWGLSFVTLWFGILYVLYRRNIILKV